MARAPKQAPHVELYPSTRRGAGGSRVKCWRIRLVGGNGERMQQGQAYSRKYDAKQGAKRAFGVDVEIREATR